MRRLNRGFFQVALENEEVTGQTEETGEASSATTVTEEPTGEVQVTVNVKTEGEATVVENAEKTEDGEATEDPKEKRIKELEAEIERLKSGESVATEDGEVGEETTSSSSSEATETVEVRTEEGEVVATVETGEGTTVVSTDAPAEVTVTEGSDGSVEVNVEVDATAGAGAAPTEGETSEEKPAVAAEDMVVIETDGEAAEVEICEAADVAEDTAELTAEIDDAEEAAVALEALAEVAKSAAANGGLDSNGARLLKIATEHIYQHMGLGKAVGIPAMESFEIPGARSSATTIAMEDISEQAKKIWAGIVNGIKQAIAWVQEFIEKVFSANGRIKARAEKLLEASKNMSGAPKSKEVGNAKLVRALSVNGKVPTNLAAEVKKTVDFFAGTVDGKTADGLKTVMDTIKSAATSSDAGKVGDTVKDVVQMISGKGLQHKVSSGIGSKAGIGEAPTGTSLSMSSVFPGEQVVWAYTPETVEAITSFRSGVGTYSDKAAKSEMVATLSPAQIADVAKAGLAYVEASKGYKAIQDQVKGLNALVSATLTNGVARGNADDSAAGKMKALLPALKAARHLIRGIHQPAGVVAVRAVQASLDLATASAKQYGAKVEEAAAA